MTAKDYILADKMPTILVKSVMNIYCFNRRLERAVPDILTIILYNMGKDRYAKTTEFGGFEFAEEMKKEGKIRKFGFFHFRDDAETLDRIIQNILMSILLQLRINYFDLNNKIIQSHLCYETAVRHGKPISVMEPVKGGTLANLPKEAADLLRDFNPDASSIICSPVCCFT